MSGQNDETLRAVWIALELIGWYVIVPLAIAALVTGVAIAMGTSWGLLRHYSVITSLLLTVAATAVLLQHMSTVTFFARLAAAEVDPANIGALRAALRGELRHASLGLLVLLAIAALNVYKPRGVTAYGRRVAQTVLSTTNDEIRAEAVSVTATKRPRWVHAVWIHAVALVLLFVIFYLASGGRGHQ
jgi:hypothetical protein